MLIVTRPRHGIAALRHFVRTAPIERCELCAAPLPDEHRHLLEPATRRVLCACRVCGDAISARPDSAFRMIPTEPRDLGEFRMSDAEWHALGLPIDMAFIFHSSREKRAVATYPGPLGATESLLGTEGWSRVVARNPVLAAFEPDVEALLVNRLNRRRAYYRAPIDRCFALVGLIRRHWRGFSGGDEVWAAIDGFFATLPAAAPPLQGRAP